MSKLQLDAEDRLRHLLTLEGLPRALLESLLDRAEILRPRALSGSGERAALAGRTVVNLFFEASTRTRNAFQIAAMRLGADVVNFEVSQSSTRKGETLADTALTLQAMGVDIFVVRAAESGALAELAGVLDAGSAVVNAGDGRAAHPTQGLLDMLTLRMHKGRDFSGLKVLLVGDVAHSRVARSNLHALRTLGAGEIRIAAPTTLLPSAEVLDGSRVFDSLNEALAGVDMVMMLRLQRERMAEGLIDSIDAYARDWQLTPQRLQLAAPDAIVMHPGPMNRGVEIAAEVADGPQSVILEQVANGVAVRMAVMQMLVENRHVVRR
jgi:aspartate carbamoyltransferase catalytic subunit